MTDLIKIYRNFITGGIFILTPEGFFGISKNNSFDFYRDIIVRSLRKEEKTKYEELLRINYEMVYYGIFNFKTNIVTINNPIILEINFEEAEKFSKKNSYIRLCKEFILSSQKKTMYNLPQDIIYKIVEFVIGKYLKFFINK